MVRRGCAEFGRFANHPLTANPVFPGSPRHDIGVRAGRSKKYHANHREAGDSVALAVLPVSRAPEGGEAPRGSMAKRLSGLASARGGLTLQAVGGEPVCSTRPLREGPARDRAGAVAAQHDRTASPTGRSRWRGLGDFA
jgi:hypothetical protein